MTIHTLFTRTPTRPGQWLKMGVLAAALHMSVLGHVVQAAQGQEQLNQNFKDVEIATVIEAVSKISGYNFIIDPRVKGKVTLIAPQSMDPAALYQTLLAVLNVHGYVAVPGDGVIKILPANLARDQMPYRTAEDNNESWVTEVVNVNHVDAAKLVAILRPLVAREGHLVALAESNKLIISDTVVNIRRVKDVLSRVDVDTRGNYEVITVEHSSAEELAKTLKGLIPKGEGGNEVKVSFDGRSNRVILTGDAQKRIQLRALIADLDIKVASEGRVQVIYLRYAKAAEIVPVLQKIAGNRVLMGSGEGSGDELTTPSVTNVTAADGTTTTTSTVQAANTAIMSDKSLKENISIEADERMNAVIVSAPTAVVTALKGVIKQLDIRRAQVLIEAIFVEISADKALDLGVEWGFAGQNGVGLLNFSGAIPNLIGNAGNPLEQSKVIGTGLSFAGGEVSASGDSGWGGFIRALNSDSSSNVLATPSILTLDNEEAEIVVGREVPFQTGSYTSGTTTSTNPFTTIERKNVGLKLKVKPQINEGNEIYLDIDQEVSDVLPKGEAVDIQTTKRQIKTRVIVGDGNMVVLGGLINEKETLVDSKVPGLGDIPGLGALFSSTQNKREKVNLMVFLRPVIIRDNTMSDYYSNKKYSYVYDEQDELLRTKDSTYLQGLRPRLPTLEQWKASEPATPFDADVKANANANGNANSESKTATDVEPANKSANRLIFPMTTDELLGL
ncbi:type II secretion system secretin GspD [Thiomicrorhabdus aquaedulcis]|uniref:type II secretion system secretin GspD n=1 Tax=Thiomicrorhabdus aquaedulcis TaxID=2211106 RepID=UPI001E3F6AAB|nr:type II secretion system secretin GspD [Thiomicrorhabdus aquaedulcis]